MIDNEDIELLTKTAVQALEDIKGKDIVVIDVSKQTTLFSRIIIATGESSRQVRALGRNVEQELKLNGFKVLSVEGLENNEWVLVDAGDIIIHTMQKNIREFYDIESLWTSLNPSHQHIKAS